MLGWRGCGYHYVLSIDGAIMRGLPETQIEAHCKKRNSHLISPDEFNMMVLRITLCSLSLILNNLTHTYIINCALIDVLGHF